MRHDPGLASWLQLSLTPGLSAAAIRALLRQFGLPQNILERKRTELAPHAGGAALEALDSDEVRGAVARALDWAAEQGNHVVTLSDPAYPKALLDIADPPPLLYARGRLELLNRAALAIFGVQRTLRGRAQRRACRRLVDGGGARHRRRHRLPEPQRAACGRDRHAGGARLRVRARLRAARAQFPAPQSPDQRARERMPGGRSGARIGLAHHRARRRRPGPRGVRDSRLHPLATRERLPRAHQ